MRVEIKYCDICGQNTGTLSGYISVRDRNKPTPVTIGVNHFDVCKKCFDLAVADIEFNRNNKELGKAYHIIKFIKNAFMRGGR